MDALKDAISCFLIDAPTHQIVNKPTHGVRCIGPPGTGKNKPCVSALNSTRIVMAQNVLKVGDPDILSKWIGNAEKAMRNLFEQVKLAAP